MADPWRDRIVRSGRQTREEPTAKPGRALLRWSAGVLVAALSLGGSATAAAAQTPPPPGSGPATPPLPPADNVFPIPAPYTATFTDSWHACRDDCSRRHEGNDVLAAEGSPEVAVES